MTGATRQQLDYWARLGLVRPRVRWGERFFSFTDLVAVETLNRLAERHIPARRLLRAIDELEQSLGHARAPLSSLRVSTNGARIVVHEPGPGGRPIEPLSGQPMPIAGRSPACPSGPMRTSIWARRCTSWDYFRNRAKFFPGLWSSIL